MEHYTGFKKQAPRPVASSQYDYLFIALVAGFLGFIVIQEVHIPKFMIVGMALVAGVYLLVKGVSKPEMVTYALVAYMPFSKELAGDFGGLAMAFNFTNLFLGFLLWAWISGKYQMQEPKWISTPLNLPIFLFLLLGFVSIARANYYGASHIFAAFIEYKRWITPILLYFFVLNTVKEREIVKNVAIIIMITITIVALMAIWDYIDQGACGSLEKCRIGGITDQPNMLAAFFNYYMFLPFGFFLNNIRRPNYWGALIPFLLCFRGIMVTFSRGGYLAFAIGLAAITFFKSRILFILLLIFAYFAFLNPDLLPAGIRYRMGQTFKTKSNYSDQMMNTENLESSSQRRVKVWKAGIEMVKDHPMFGIGYGLFPFMIKGYWDGGKMDSHNTYLIIAAEMGIPALLVFLLIIGMMFWQALRLYQSTKDPFAKSFALGWLGGIFAMLISNMFGSRLDAQEVSSYLWIIAALIVRFRRLDQQEKKQGTQEDQIPAGEAKHIPWFERKGAY